jgi:hypothetical protein
MMHKKRIFSVAPVETAEELADKLTKYSWCLCNGFKLGELLFLNDSTSEDGAQEFGVVIDTDRKQIESITFGWCTTEKALEYIKELQQSLEDKTYDAFTLIHNKIEDSAKHERCSYCA